MNEPSPVTRSIGTHKWTSFMMDIFYNLSWLDWLRYGISSRTGFFQSEEYDPEQTCVIEVRPPFAYVIELSYDRRILDCITYKYKHPFDPAKNKLCDLIRKDNPYSILRDSYLEISRDSYLITYSLLHGVDFVPKKN